MEQDRRQVLFLCVHNSCRSQMAEAFVNRELGDRYIAFSAGSEPTRLDPYAVQVMAEMGINISQHRSKSVEEFRGQEFDLVVTLCAEEVCPTCLGAGDKIHLPFPDPHRFMGNENEMLDQYRKLRDDIRGRVLGLLVAEAGRREK